jgi:hypothetical protein
MVEVFFLWVVVEEWIVVYLLIDDVMEGVEVYSIVDMMEGVEVYLIDDVMEEKT